MKQKKLLFKKHGPPYLVCILSILLFIQCGKDDSPNGESSEDQGYLSLPDIPYDYTSLPSKGVPHSANDVNTVSGNPITNDGATLGRVLFYDKKLSKNNTISCASCHKQEFAFADNVAKSKGVNGLTIRNSIHLVNIRHFGGAMFWDSRTRTLEEQTLLPIQDHIEMGSTLPEMLAKLEKTTYYKALFKKAFGDEAITSDRVSKALAQFIRSLNSYGSKFDRGVPMTPQEQAGFFKFHEQGASPPTTFTVSCMECHQGVQQVFFVNDSLPILNFPIEQNGRGFEDEPTFMKVANMKNIELTAPYGHDGRYATLEILLTHHGNNVSDEDRANLIAFLKTLTDEEFTKDVRYSNPFKK
ncbi:Cytochrome c551 peroxidase precursor [compost metagenome]